jgi:hypothetical protein
MAKRVGPRGFADWSPKEGFPPWEGLAAYHVVEISRNALDTIELITEPRGQGHDDHTARAKDAVINAGKAALYATKAFCSTMGHLDKRSSLDKEKWEPKESWQLWERWVPVVEKDMKDLEVAARNNEWTHESGVTQSAFTAQLLDHAQLHIKVLGEEYGSP